MEASSTADRELRRISTVAPNLDVGADIDGHRWLGKVATKGIRTWWKALRVNAKLFGLGAQGVVPGTTAFLRLDARLDSVSIEFVLRVQPKYGLTRIARSLTKIAYAPRLCVCGV